MKVFTSWDRWTCRREPFNGRPGNYRVGSGGGREVSRSQWWTQLHHTYIIIYILFLSDEGIIPAIAPFLGPTLTPSMPYSVLYSGRP